MPLKTAQAASEKIQQMVYDVYAGGFHALQAEVTIDYTQQGRYSIFMGAQTYGMLGRLAPWNGSFNSDGWVLAERLQPEKHQSIATWRGETETNTYLYGRDGSFISYSVEEHDKAKEVKEVEDELTQGTIDAFTAGLVVFEQVAAGGKCEGSSEVFDGKRRFEQIMRDQGEEELKSSRYNIFKGKARKCTLEIKPVAGEWREKPRGWMSIQEQGRERGMMPTIWLAQLAADSPAVPVRIQVKTAFGTLFMHLAEYRSGENIVVADQRGR
ncbi:MAG: DUF3108 domain-containing protein [Alphaproteobacteria bacterium]